MRQEWDINAEGPGKILLKCEYKYGQQKYMQSIGTKNERGEITNKNNRAKNVQDETAGFWEKMFADKGMKTTEKKHMGIPGRKSCTGGKKSHGQGKRRDGWRKNPRRYRGHNKRPKK